MSRVSPAEPGYLRGSPASRDASSPGLRGPAARRGPAVLPLRCCRGGCSLPPRGLVELTGRAWLRVCSHPVGSCLFFVLGGALRGRAVLLSRERVCGWEQAGYFTFSEEFSTFLLCLSPSINCVCNGENQRWELG